MTGSPVGTSHLCFSFLLHLLLQLFCQAFVGCSLVFILVSVSGVFSLILRLSAWICSALCSGCRSLHLYCVFLLFSHPILLVAFVLPVLCYSSVFLRGVFEVSFLSWGFPFLVSFSSSLCLSTHGPFGFRSYGLSCGPFRCALLLLPYASSPYCLFRPWASSFAF